MGRTTDDFDSAMGAWRHARDWKETMDEIDADATAVPHSEANKALAEEGTRDDTTPPGGLSASNVGPLSTQESSESPPTGIVSGADPDNPGLWVDTLTCTHGVSKVTRLVHTPEATVDTWQAAGVFHGMKFGCTCLADWVAVYRRQNFP